MITIRTRPRSCCIAINARPRYLHRAVWYLTETNYFDNTRNMKIDDAVTALSGLAQETRLSIYRLLVQAGPEGLAAGRIGEKLKVPGATMSFI